MRELSVQELDQASGGIAPILGIIVAVAGVAVRNRVARTVIEAAGIGLAGHSLVEWGKSQNSLEYLPH